MDYSDSKGRPTEKWVVIKEFKGFQTKLDATKISNGANANGQNTTANNSDRISNRNLGYEMFPSTETASVAATPIISSHVFRKRDGTNIIMRSYTTFLEIYNPDSASWEILKSGYTTGKKFGFGDYNINTNTHSYVYFGNAVEYFSRWSGAYCKLTTAIAPADTTIYVNNTDDYAASGTVIVDGTTLTYASKTGTTFVLSGAASITVANGTGVQQSVETSASNPKGNIYLVYSNRLFIAGIIATPQAVYFSTYGDAMTYTSAVLVNSSTATSPGIFNLGEGGGSVTGASFDEQSIYFFKRSIIYKATLSDSLYTIQPLKPFDGKSQTMGSVASRAIFTGGNATFFATPDNQLLALERLAGLDYPQASAISDIIKPTTDQGDFSSAAGIVFKDKAYFAYKSTSDAIFNDTVLVWNISKKIWDSPITGWNVSDFFVYNDGTTEDLYFCDATAPNVYKVNSTPVDGEFDVTASWRSGQYEFGAPESLKQLSNVFIEGYISPSTTLTISLLLDENGTTQKYTTTLNGTNDNYLYDAPVFNLFGLKPFGVERFGSNADTSGKVKFRIYLGKDIKAIPFYNCQIEFASDGSNQQWEVLNYGFLVKQYTQPILKKLFKAFR